MRKSYSSEFKVNAVKRAKVIGNRATGQCTKCYNCALAANASRGFYWRHYVLACGFYSTAAYKRLKLRDLTEEMDAILFKEDALTFFNGTNPGSVVVSSEAEEELQSTLDSLCSHACHPVLDCIIKSYHHTKTNKAMYRITATQLTV
eukprot:m.54074 g.54074  ORF g.54074 m.54074 type:complete len:147 (+) comp34311_c0_seq2:1908-2348(+)